MSKKARTRMYRLVLAAILITAALSALFWLSPPANAVIIEGPYLCTYYNNAHHSNVVGARGIGCCGEVISWGVVTQYGQCQELLCTDVLCPN